MQDFLDSLLIHVTRYKNNLGRLLFVILFMIPVMCDTVWGKKENISFVECVRRNVMNLANYLPHFCCVAKIITGYGKVGNVKRIKEYVVQRSLNYLLIACLDLSARLCVLYFCVYLFFPPPT